MLKRIKVFLIIGFILMQSVICFNGVQVYASSVKVIKDTIVVEEGETYDGHGQTIVAVGMGDGSQDENQKPIFKLKRGAKLKNVRIAYPGCDGVHCYGDNTVENVIWEDIGEDALTVKGGSGSNAGTIWIKNCQAYNGDDKVIQINAPCTLKVYGFTAENIGKLIRQCGGTTFKCTIVLDSCTIKNAKECVARTDSKSTVLYYRNLRTSNVPRLWIFPSTSQIHAY